MAALDLGLRLLGLPSCLSMLEGETVDVVVSIGAEEEAEGCFGLVNAMATHYFFGK